MLLTEAIELYLTHLGAAKRSENTIIAYGSDLSQIRRLLDNGAPAGEGSLGIADVNARTLEAAFARFGTDKKATTVRRAHTAWTQMFAYLRRIGLTDRDPMGGVAIPFMRGSGTPKSIKSEGLAYRLLAAVGDPPDGAHSAWPTRDQLIIITFLGVGLRVSEASDLQWRSVTVTQQALTLTVVGKGEKERTIPAPGGFDRHLETYRREVIELHRDPTPTDPLFMSRSAGTKLSRHQLQTVVRRAYQGAGVQADVPDGAFCHALRHTFAYDLLDNGATIVEIQQLLGHSSIATTRRYLDARPGHLVDAIASTSMAAALRSPENFTP